MDADRFDTLTRSLGAPTSRRAALGATLAGGLLSALGVSRTIPEARAAQNGICNIAFLANVRLGPSMGLSLSAEGQPGSLRGDLSFSVDQTGRLTGELKVPSGERFPVVGQATGNSLQARIELAPQVALVVVGVGEQEVAACRGAIDGMLSGPKVGDLGDWHAAVGAGGRSSSDGTAQGGRADSGGGGRTTRGGGAASGSGSPDGDSGGGRGSAANSSDAPPCPEGQTLCDDGECHDLGFDEDNCGACGNACPPGNQPCERGVCGTEGAVDCEIGQVRCGAICCAAGETCVIGECAPLASNSCAEPLVDCGGACVNTSTDPLNCGQCGLPCASELGAGTCIGGACTCSPGTTRCDDVCVNTDLDPLNCGRCGNACADDEECFGGACAADETACPSGQTRCGDACVNTTSDAANCSACGRACAAGEECRGSLCVPIGGGGGCKTGLTPCGATCADLQADANNCGACGAACPAGETCVGGECAPGATAGQTAGCPEGQILCGDTCRDALPNFGSDSLSCPGGGAPPTACPVGRVLCNGACFPEGACQPTDCPPGWGYCYGVCRDFLNDPGYCGGCSTGCTGGAYCAAGQCVYCSAGLTPCGAICVDTATDLANCGFCGNACGTQCLDGQCTGVGPSPTNTCPEGQTRCGDACVDTTSDNANCGQCGNVCNEANACSGGSCVNSDAVCKRIDSNLSACVTRCADTRTDPEHCGGCFSPCGPGTECDGGLCFRTAASANTATLVGEELPAFSCPEGQVDCGGGCTDLYFDPFNCGGCGAACGPDIICDFGVCGAPPAPPPAPENADPAPLTEPEAGDATCVTGGGACDPASPGSCCSGACNDDGACA